jgi:hypothetical protein
MSVYSAVSLFAASEWDLVTPELSSTLWIESQTPAPSSLWERFHTTCDERADKTFRRLGPLQTMRREAFAHGREVPGDVNDTAHAAFHRTLGYGVSEVITTSDPFMWVNYRWERLGEFLRNSLQDISENWDELAEQSPAHGDSPSPTQDVIDDPNGTNVVQQILWSHKHSSGMGIRGGGPSIFWSGSVRHKRKKLFVWYIRYNLKHVDDNEVENIIVFPVGKGRRVSTGLTYDPFNPSDLRYALRFHQKVWRDADLVAGISVGDHSRFFVGLTREW